MEQSDGAPSSAIAAERTSGAVVNNKKQNAHQELNPPTKGENAENIEAGDTQISDARGGYLRLAKVPMGKTQFWTVLLGYVYEPMMLHYRHQLTSHASCHLFSLNVGMLLAALDFNIIATAVPIISSELGEYRKSAWIGTGFLVSMALVLPIYAKLGVIFGNDTMFIIATVIFILGSGLCGGAKTMNMLIAARIVQGIGGGGIYGLVNV